MMRRALLFERHEHGQALMELGFVLPLGVLFTFACLQFALLFLAYLGMMNNARDAARWLVLNPHQLDTTAVTAIKSRVPPGIDPTKLTIAISPTCTTLTAGKCPTRLPGDPVTLTFSYNASSLIFLPTAAGCCGFTATIPTTLPTYVIRMMVEPS